MDRPIDQIHGSMNGKALYAVTLSRAVLQRARELSATGVAPDWIEEPGDILTVKVLTPDPEWFIDLGRRIDSALRAR